jgi:hypothetical protein
LCTESTVDVPGCAGRTAGSPRISREYCWRSLLEDPFGTERTADVPGCAGRTAGSPRISRDWMSLLEVPLGTKRTADLPGCAGRTAGNHRMSREDRWRALLEVPLVTERKADVPCRMCKEDSLKTQNKQGRLLEVHVEQLTSQGVRGG